MGTAAATLGDVMVVEDDRTIGETLRDVLEDEGYQVAWAANGRDALERLRAAGHRPALILLDLAMPVMDGWEFRSAMQRDPELATIPVVVISAEHGVDQRVARMAVAGFLPKPFELSALLDAVHRYC